jgi:glycosyltransferase involved in cell wall biosynthesis
MRFVYLSTDPGIAWGGAKGASVHLGEIVEALAREGADVLVLVSDVAPAAPAASPRVTVEKLPVPRKHVSVDELLAGESVLAGWLEERIRVFGASALQERMALYTAAGSTAAHALGIPHLVELNAPLPEEAARYRTLERPDAALELERTVLSSADLVFPVSSPLADYASKRGARRIEVMPNAVWLELFEALPTRTDGDGPIAVFAGALRPWHGVETIAEAWKRLGSDAPRLRVIGDGPGRDALAAVGGEMMGAVAHIDVPALLVSADIGLAPYAADAPTYFSPLKLFEYLAAGLAVVAADIPGVTDIVGEDGALLMPPGDTDALASGVAALAADADLRSRLRAKARSIAQLHTWEQRAGRILRAVHELSRKKAVPA